MMSGARRREDIFVSMGIIVAQLGPDPDGEVASLVKRLAENFRYWELLIVVDADDLETQEWALRTTSNIRLLKVLRETPGFRRRQCVASEAIGDILVISAPEELSQVDILALIAQCESSDALITVRRTGTALRSAPLIALGKSAGFQVDVRDMVTAAYPRTIINRLLRHPDAALAIRFPPFDRNIPVQVNLCQPTRGFRRRNWNNSTLYRLGIVQQLAISSAPRVLGLIELLSLGVGFAAMLYALYAVVVWLTLDNIQAGWFTTSLILSMTAMFLGFAILGLSMGLQRLLDLAGGTANDDVLDEVNRIDLFDAVTHDLNIEVETQAEKTFAPVHPQYGKTNP